MGHFNSVFVLRGWLKKKNRVFETYHAATGIRKGETRKKVRKLSDEAELGDPLQLLTDFDSFWRCFISLNTREARSD